MASDDVFALLPFVDQAQQGLGFRALGFFLLWPCARVCALWRQPNEGFPHELRDYAIFKVGSKGGVVLGKFLRKVAFAHNLYPVRKLHTTPSALA